MVELVEIKSTVAETLGTSRLFRAFFRGYVSAALWSTCGDDGEPLDRTKTARDIDSESMFRMLADCAAFLDSVQFHWDEWSGEETYEKGGHVFWLNRNGHGVTFMDGGWEYAEYFYRAANNAGACDLYVGDDSSVYLA